MGDIYRKKINYLRICITENNNLEYTYYKDKRNVKNLEKKITTSEINTLIKSAARCGIDKIRFTGGEPLLHEDICYLVAESKRIPSVREVCITTNGLLLEDMANELKESGLDRVNITLDTLDPEIYKKMVVDGNFEKVLRGIKKCEDIGIQVCINAVIVRGLNEKGLLDLVKWTIDENIKVRFIQPITDILLPGIEVVSGYEIRKKIENLFSLSMVESSYGSTAQYWKIDKSKGKIGFIDLMSHRFSTECNRIRITSNGEMKKGTHDEYTLNIVDFIRKGMSHTVIDAILRNEIGGIYLEKNT
jgi:cyclic pyranopterin phosphate synthase